MGHIRAKTKRTAITTCHKNRSKNNKQQEQRQLNSKSKNNKKEQQLSTTTEKQRFTRRRRRRRRKAENQSRIEHVRLFEVEEICLRGNKNVSVVVAFLMWSGSELRTDKTQMRDCTLTSRPAPTGWEWQATDAGTRVKWSRRREQLQEIIQTSRSGRGNSDETEACKYRKFERRRATSGADRVLVWCVQL